MFFEEGKKKSVKTINHSLCKKAHKFLFWLCFVAFLFFPMVRCNLHKCPSGKKKPFCFSFWTFFQTAHQSVILSRMVKQRMKHILHCFISSCSSVSLSSQPQESLSQTISKKLKQKKTVFKLHWPQIVYSESLSDEESSSPSSSFFSSTFCCSSCCFLICSNLCLR